MPTEATMQATSISAGRSDNGRALAMCLAMVSCNSLRLPLICLFAMLFSLTLWRAPSFAGEILNEVRSQKMLSCGVSEGLAGFSLKDREGNWQGIGPDFCRAVAAAALGDANKVEFIPLKTASRFPMLLSGRIELLAHTATVTFGREAGIGARFAGVYFFDGQGFMVLRSAKKLTIRDLNGATVCLVKGTTHQANLANTFQKHKMKYTPLMIESMQEAADALLKGTCRAVTSDQSQLVAIRATTPDGLKRFEIIPGTFSVEPIGPAVYRGDDEWFLLVRWVLYALIEAEELGVTRENVRTLLKDPGSIALRDFLITSGKTGKALGLSKDWVVTTIGTVGNYGEIYERNFGEKSSLKIERGHNRLWSAGGLMYAPPFQ